MSNQNCAPKLSAIDVIGRPTQPKSATVDRTVDWAKRHKRQHPVRRVEADAFHREAQFGTNSSSSAALRI